ncbi:Lysophospholipase, alpha-beta hydrolase superfamily [Allopseudospirillum japonicum]|uniref:Lysophospholipase, alpha-beta hydrolase superfamily n=1 Tax=Allopseudospirillum japonicum TaxID=64971 RepID=A0A1H6UU50_9GAMM|nr:alpha/beta hydrolase [Allopseudospirillum japonicum]SEI91585.1 Lysophospholipase, alpha-beta hydrolase superfamily [Allopseudospirillum japonicum]
MQKSAQVQLAHWLIGLNTDQLPDLGLPSLVYPQTHMPPVWQTYLQTYQLAQATESAHEYAFGWQRIQTEHASYQILRQRWQPAQPRACVLICHGYYDHTGLYAEVIDFALKQGLAVECFDLPGHGLSSGRRASIRCFSEYQHILQAILADLPTADQPLFALGQSTGAAILTQHLLEVAPSPWQHISLISPLVRPVNWRQIRWLWRTLSPWVTRVPRVFKANSHQASFVDFLQQDPLQSKHVDVAWVGALIAWVDWVTQVPAQTQVPVLLVQGDADQTVDWRFNLPVLAQQVGAKNPVIIAGARHHLVNESPAYRAPLWEALAQAWR